VPAYELAYLQDKHDYDYKPAGSFASDPAGSVLLVGSVMGEAYKVDVNVGIVPIPRSYAAAVADPVYGAKWRAACDDDFEGKYTLLKTWDWELVKSVPIGRRIIRGKWIFAVKYMSDGTVDKFKARYVGRGYSYSQVQGVDYIDSFCSTLRLESLRVFLDGPCVNDDDLLEVDVVKAFPSGDWDGTEGTVICVDPKHACLDPNQKSCLAWIQTKKSACVDPNQKSCLVWIQTKKLACVDPKLTCVDPKPKLSLCGSKTKSGSKTKKR